MHIFLDESGNFTGDKDECFIVGGFAANDERATAKAFRVGMVDSSASPNIQIADWICGALYRYHTSHPSGEEFYQILHGSIVKFTEPFKDFWGEVPENKKPPS